MIDYENANPNINWGFYPQYEFKVPYKEIHGRCRNGFKGCDCDYYCDCSDYGCGHYSNHLECWIDEEYKVYNWNETIQDYNMNITTKIYIRVSCCSIGDFWMKEFDTLGELEECVERILDYEKMNREIDWDEYHRFGFSEW